MGDMAEDKTRDDLSPQATGALLRLLLEGATTRISSTRLEGRTVWIKRFDAEPRPLAKRVHAALSPLLPAAFRASPEVGPAGCVEREARKLAAFRAAGFLSPRIVHRGAAVLVFSEAAPIAENELVRLRAAGDDEGHDALLVDAAGALGRAHARGLCHGRPHPRDMFVQGGEWGFLDFEEEPEAVMPLRFAQARDVWLLFMQVAHRALGRSTPARAFAAYRAAAPAETVAALRRVVAMLSLLLPALTLLKPVGLGKDGRRLLDAICFLRLALRMPEAEHAEPPVHPAAAPQPNTGSRT